MTFTSTYRSKRLLQSQLGSEAFEKFFKNEPVMFYDDSKEVLYSIHLVYGGHVLVSKQQNGRDERGSILESKEDKLYDAVASFIVNAKQNKITWGCGKLGIVFPDAMPPRDLSFITFVTSHSSYIYDKSILLLKIIGYILVFPYFIAKLLFDDSDISLEFIFFYVVGSLIIPLIFPVMASQPTGSNVPTPIQFDGILYLLAELYLLGIFILSGIKIKYDKWRKEWS